MDCPANGDELTASVLAWLTVWGADGVPEAPEEGRVYVCTLSGEFDGKPRAYSVPPGGTATDVTGFDTDSQVTLATNDTWYDLCAVTLPAPGKYLLSYHAVVSLGGTGTLGVIGTTEIYDTVAGAQVSHSALSTNLNTVGGNTHSGPHSLTMRFNYDSGTTRGLTLRGKRVDGFGTTGVGAVISVQFLEYTRLPVS
jgi:hypothetical protein